MRLLPSLLLAGSVGMIALACGGASDQDVLSASSSSSSSSSSSGSTSGDTTSSSSGATGSSSGSTTSGSSGGPNPPADGGKPTPSACTPEEEPNNVADDATKLDVSGSMCGTLLPITEIDFMTFSLPSDTKTMELTFSGSIKLLIFIEGRDQPVELSPTSSPAIPVVAGKRYVIRISNAGGPAAKVDWRVNVKVVTS